MSQTTVLDGPRPNPNIKSREQLISEGADAMISALENYLRGLEIDVRKVTPEAKRVARGNFEGALKAIVEAK